MEGSRLGLEQAVDSAALFHSCMETKGFLSAAVVTPDGMVHRGAGSCAQRRPLTAPAFLVCEDLVSCLLTNATVPYHLVSLMALPLIQGCQLATRSKNDFFPDFSAYLINVLSRSHGDLW